MLKPIQKAEIIRLYKRTELRPGEDVIDNQPKTIAKELGITERQVNHVLDVETKLKQLKQ